jgi:hypothetical protein
MLIDVFSIDVPVNSPNDFQTRDLFFINAPTFKDYTSPFKQTLMAFIHIYF